jgi:Uma2 family endonuclease
MSTVLAPGDRVILHDVSWETYQRLLDENIDNCGTRFTYDDGELEIMTTSLGHEHVNRTLADIVRITAQEIGRPFVNAGSTTFKRQDKTKGFEPDTCFYFRHAKEVRRKREIDPLTGPRRNW